MMNNVKTIISTMSKSVIGLILGTILYIGYFYVDGFMTHSMILFGLLFLVRVWSKSRSKQIAANINREIKEITQKKVS